MVLLFFHRSVFCKNDQLGYCTDHTCQQCKTPFEGLSREEPTPSPGTPSPGTPSPTENCPDTVLSGQFDLNDGSIDYYINIGQCWNWDKFECQPCGPQTTHSIKYEVDETSSCSREVIRNARADGCSGGADADRGRFLAACNEHDICYSMLGMPKDVCDDLFLDNMYDICDHDGDILCDAAAFIFYEAVKWSGFAQDGYDGNQMWAAEHCGTPPPPPENPSHAPIFGRWEPAGLSGPSIIQSVEYGFETTKGEEITDTHAASIETSISAGFEYMGVSGSTTITATYAQEISKTVSKSLTTYWAETKEVSCPDSVESPTGNWFLFQWKMEQEAVGNSIGFEGRSKDYVCSWSNLDPPRCPVSSCAFLLAKSLWIPCHQSNGSAVLPPICFLQK
jgi:hypothetical protein